MNPQILKYFKLAAKLAVTIIALYFVYTKIDLAELWQLVKNANFFLIIPAILAFIFSKIVSSYRLNIYFKNIDIDLSEMFNLKLYWLGMFYNLSLPGGIGGDGYKVWFLKKRFNVKTKDIFWAVLLDRVIGVLALFCLAVVFFYFVPYHFKLKYFIGLLIPLSILVTFWVYRRFFTTHVSIFLRTNLQSLWVQILQTISALFILFSLGIYDHTMTYIFVFLVSSIVAVLPITIGGAGSREFTFLLGARLLQLDVNASIALSLIFYSITAIVSLWGIYYVVQPGALKLNLADKMD